MERSAKATQEMTDETASLVVVRTCNVRIAQVHLNYTGRIFCVHCSVSVIVIRMSNVMGAKFLYRT
jgi:hypothetical protein